MRAWLYYRLSRDEDEEMNSLQNQRQILVDYAEQNGYEIVGESFDDNVSGMTFKRKGLGELEIAVDEGKIDVVLVKDLSRLGCHKTQTKLFIDQMIKAAGGVPAAVSVIHLLYRYISYYQDQIYRCFQSLNQSKKVHLSHCRE